MRAIVTSRLARAAHAYAAHGWAVFPCLERGKTPLTEHGCKDATRTPDHVAAWWERWPDANIGIATGAPSRLLVVDLDGYEGPANWSRVTEQHHGGAPLTLTASTGSGGLHLVYAAQRETRNTASRIGVGIDTRGDGGYIIAPPSIHPNGQRYTWLNHQPVVEAPTWLIDALEPPRPTSPPAAAPRLVHAGETTAYGHAAVERVLDDLSRTGEGGRNDALNRAAYALARLAAAGHIPHPHIEPQLRVVAHQIGLTDTETTNTIASGIRAGLDRPVAAPPPAAYEPPRWQPPRHHAPRLHPPRHAA